MLSMGLMTRKWADIFIDTHPFIKEFESGKVSCRLGDDMPRIWISDLGSRHGTASSVFKEP